MTWTRPFRSVLKRNDRLRSLYADLDLFRKYGTWRPERIALEPHGLTLFVDPSEPRGRALLRSRWADFAVWPLLDHAAPLEAVLHSDCLPSQTWIAGQPITPQEPS